MSARLVPLSLAALLLLGGCAGSPAPSPAPPAEDPGILPPNDAECFTGEPAWSLDLADYARQSETYMFGLGIPITDVEMTGSQTVQFSEDGLMSVITDVTTTGVLVVAGVGNVPISAHSGVGGSGDWSLDDEGTMTIDNWAAVNPDVELDPTDPAADVPIPIVDFATIESIDVTCSPGLLSLVTGEAPLVPLFTR